MRRPAFAVLVLSTLVLCGCQGLAIHDTESLLFPGLRRSEIVGFVAGFGTTLPPCPT